MKSIKLKWVRTSLVGSVSATRPRGTAYIVSYMSLLQGLIQKPPPKGFGSPEGIMQLKIGLRLDGLVVEHSEEIGSYEAAVSQIQEEIGIASQITGGNVQGARDRIWDIPLPKEIELLLEDSQHAVLVKLLEESEFNVPTLAVGEMIEEIKAAPDVKVTRE